jgi:hypothetical protein
MVALDVSVPALPRAAYQRLLVGQSDGSRHWEEGRIAQAWVQACRDLDAGIR